MSENKKTGEIGGCGDTPLSADGVRRRLDCLAHPYAANVLLPESREGETIQQTLERFCIGCLNNINSNRSEANLSS